jgi:cardiolipin synthase
MTRSSRWFGGFMLRRIVITLALATAAFAESGCAFMTQMAPKSQRDHYSFTPSFSVEDPQFRRSLDSVGSVMVGGNAATLLENGDGVFPAIIKDIGEARVSVDIEVYIFNSDEVGRRLAGTLIEAAGRGVQVRLLVDAQGGKLKNLRKEMEAAGVNCESYRPASHYSLVGRRTHRKLVIVDGKIGYTGGFGFDKRWLGDARDKSEWHDSAVRVTGPVVAQMQAIFSEDWTFTTGEILAGNTFYPTTEQAGSMQAQAIKASKGDSSSLPKMLYFMAIQAARKTIHIQNAYFLPDQQIRTALIGAVQRGVDVKVMVPGKQIDVPMVRQASRKHYGPMLEAGVKIYEYQPTMLHSKTLVVDGLFSTIGSINFDVRSMSTNAEESLSFYDRTFAESMEAMFQRDLTLCQEVTFDAWKSRGSSARVTETFSWIWEPYY